MVSACRICLFHHEGNIGRDASDLINDHIERSFPFYLFIWTNGHIIGICTKARY